LHSRWTESIGRGKREEEEEEEAGEEGNGGRGQMSPMGEQHKMADDRVRRGGR
jgi:hypothetical protein